MFILIIITIQVIPVEHGNVRQYHSKPMFLKNTSTTIMIIQTLNLKALELTPASYNAVYNNLQVLQAKVFCSQIIAYL